MPDYPRLPDPPEPAPDDTAILYGCRILQFLLQTDVYCTATVDQLKAAEHSAYYAVTATGILPAAVDRLSAVRHEIAATLRRRTADAEQTAQDAQPAGLAPPGAPIDERADGYNGNGGPRVPRRPYPLAPASGDRLPIPAIDF